MSLVLNVEILGEFKKLTAATQGANKQLSGLQGAAQKVSSGIGKAFGAIGIGLSFAFITRELKQASKAAVEDAKSQGLLATALENTTGANNQQIASVEKSISKMSNQAAIADDQLRPAFAKLARSTGDIGKSTELMSLALDVAAGTGKNLDTVVNALSRAVGPDGTTGALERLAPAIKGASDPLAELEKLFGGSAEKAANLDPYQRMTVAMGEIQESIGALLLPVLEKFSDWFLETLPEIQKFVDGMMKALEDPDVQKAFDSMNTSLKNIGDTIGLLFGATESDKAKGFEAFWIGAAALIDGVANSARMLMEILAPLFAVFGNDALFKDQVQEIVNDLRYGDGNSPSSAIRPGTISTPGQLTRNQNVTININKGNITAQEIADKLNRANRASGTSLVR